MKQHRFVLFTTVALLMLATGAAPAVDGALTSARASVPVSAGPTATPARSASTSRTYDAVFGPSRLDTAVECSKRAFQASGSADTIVLATGYDWPDAVGGSALAGAYGCPLLLTSPSPLSQQVIDEARRLNVSRVVILGSNRAISDAVEAALTALDVNGHGLEVLRVGGTDRFETAARIASATVDVLTSKGGTYDGVAFFATGQNFPDALAAAPIAAAERWPILLVKPTGLSSPTADAIASLDVTRGIILGSASAVTTAVADALTAALPAPPERVFGATRYRTALAVAHLGVANGLSWDGFALATGTNFPDALAGGVMAGTLGSVVLLTPGTSLDASVSAELTAHKDGIATVRFLGSTKALSQGVRDAVRRALGDTEGLLLPEDLTYRGAFRLPEGTDWDAHSWNWADASIAYRPNGDPGGPADGYPGSLFGLGHDVFMNVGEIDIPAPVVSPGKEVDDLDTASTLQPFTEVMSGFISGMEVLNAGLEYLPAQGSQTSDKLYFCWGERLQYDRVVTHGWCDADLSTPDVAGGWFLGDLDVRGTNEYVFAIPSDWAATYTPGRLLATGRYKDGGQASQGPTIFAYAPWEAGDPPPAGTTLPYTTLLRYDIVDEGTHMLDGYEHSDEWMNAAWLTREGSGAVVFVGTKGIDETRETWYGYANGDDGYAEPPTDLPNNEKGWWSDRFEGRMLFYDPADLAAVATGEEPANGPQPYAVMDVDPYLYHVTYSQQKRHVAGVTYDRERRLLYMTEPFADGDKPIVHVWQVGE